MKKLKIFFSTLLVGLAILFTSCSLINNNVNDTANGVSNDVIEEIYSQIDDDLSNQDYSSNISFDNTNDSDAEVENSSLNFFEITNKIETEVIKANVRIEASFYTRSWGGYNAVASSIGSGVIIKKAETRGHTYYYCLTNNHVVYNEYNQASYVVEDVYETEYKGTLLYSSNDYDLALLRFESDADLYVIEFAEDDNYVGYVAAIGEANAKSNTLTNGYVTGTETFEPNEEDKEESNVTFEVITHSAYIQSGSSGGMLLNMNLKLIGINFASKLNIDSSWDYSYAIPLSKIKEFLTICNSKVGFSI